MKLENHLASQSQPPLARRGRRRSRIIAQDLLRLYDFSDPEAGQAQLSSLAIPNKPSIVGVASRRVIGQLEEAGTALFCRGVETTITLDEEKLKATGVFLFASLLEQFLGLYVRAELVH